ncbi:MAG TPA: tyrosine-type recombinase/integrase [Thermoanaerobaculia bacterium]
MRGKITKRLVDSIQADPERDVLVWDTDLAGFGLRISRGGVKSYVFQYKLHGRARRMTLGEHGRDLTLEAARKLAVARRLAVQAGGDPATEAEAAAAAPTVRDLAARYLTEHAAKRSASTRRAAEMLFRLYLIPALGSRKVAAVTWNDLDALHRKLAHTPYQANRLLSLASKAWALAARWGWFPRTLPNPARDHDRYPEQPRGQALDHDQLVRLGAALDQERNGATSVAALRFCLLTGCRPGEALAAQWEDIDFAARVWRLPAAKTGPRAVYLGQAAVDVLSGLARGGRWLFSGRVDGAALTSLRALWERVADRAELPKGLRLYDATRHTFATTAAELEVPRDVRQLLMGHAVSRDAHDRYVHATGVLLRAADLVAGELSAALGGEKITAAPLLRFRATGSR